MHIFAALTLLMGCIFTNYYIVVSGFSKFEYHHILFYTASWSKISLSRGKLLRALKYPLSRWIKHLAWLMAVNSYTELTDYSIKETLHSRHCCFMVRIKYLFRKLSILNSLNWFVLYQLLQVYCESCDAIFVEGKLPGMFPQELNHPPKSITIARRFLYHFYSIPV